MGRAKSKLTCIPISRAADLNEIVSTLENPDFKEYFQSLGTETILKEIYSEDYDQGEFSEIMDRAFVYEAHDAEPIMGILSRMPEQAELENFVDRLRESVTEEVFDKCEIF